MRRSSVVAVRQHEVEGTGRRVAHLALDRRRRRCGGCGSARARRRTARSGTRPRARRSSRRGSRSSPAAARWPGRRGRRRRAAGGRAAAARGQRASARRVEPREAERHRAAAALAERRPERVVLLRRGAAPIAAAPRASAIAFSSRWPPPIVPTHLVGRHQHARAGARAAPSRATASTSTTIAGRPSSSHWQAMRAGRGRSCARSLPARSRPHRVDRAQDRLAASPARAAADRRGARRPPRPHRGSRRTPRTAAAAAARRPPCCGGCCPRRCAFSNSAHVEHRRAVVGGRDLVGARRVRHQQAGLRMPDQLFHRQPAHALDEARPRPGRCRWPGSASGRRRAARRRAAASIRRSACRPPPR